MKCFGCKLHHLLSCKKFFKHQFRWTHATSVWRWVLKGGMDIHSEHIIVQLLRWISLYDNKMYPFSEFLFFSFLKWYFSEFWMKNFEHFAWCMHNFHSCNHAVSVDFGSIWFGKLWLHSKKKSFCLIRFELELPKDATSEGLWKKVFRFLIYGSHHLINRFMLFINSTHIPD